eukprot:Nitzschia sp. Nitz4//scaffold156_size52432//47935//48660//NITZ4_006833-RA/size52432-processed-gene-0.33-mRNA-1//-1//CDS//3329537433//1520//frame0
MLTHSFPLRWDKLSCSLAVILLLCWRTNAQANDTIPFQPLPYSYKSLEPHLSRFTVQSQHEKIYRKAVVTTNAMVQSIDRLQNASLQDIVRDSHIWNPPLYHNAAMSWNFAFYFNGMTASYHPPANSILKLFNTTSGFETFDDFKLAFAKSALSLYGSGWTWLLFDSSTKSLTVKSTPNADNPLVENDDYAPILALDIWEHAYHADYPNNRALYVQTFLNWLVDWKYVEEKLIKAKSSRRK